MPAYPGSTDCARDMGSFIISIIGAPSLTEDTTDGRTECCVGVRGDESIADAGEASEYGEFPRTWITCSGATDVASESMVYSDGALVFFFLTGVDDLADDVRALPGLAVLFRVGSGGGDFARTVLGCEPVVDVISVLS